MTGIAAPLCSSARAFAALINAVSVSASSIIVTSPVFGFTEAALPDVTVKFNAPVPEPPLISGVMSNTGSPNVFGPGSSIISGD